MLEKVTFRTFKSLKDVSVDLGLVNVFIGANGSGKSNLLEALGVLSAAADGKVDDRSLLARGVRPGVPALYKSAFPSRGRERIPPHLFFSAHGNGAKYEVTLHNPLEDPAPAWRFKTEVWEDAHETHVRRAPAQQKKSDPERGLAALKLVEVESGPSAALLKRLQNYVIFTPTTPVLRGVSPDPQPKQPLGLSGGNLPTALQGLLHQHGKDERSKQIYRDALELIDWAKSYDCAPSGSLALSPAAAASKFVVRFRDKFMQEKRNVLSGYDVSEGALLVLFLAVIAGSNGTPRLCAVDNADHGLNPRLARSLMNRFCEWLLMAEGEQQVLLTTHNPLVLDGLPLQNSDVRLFTVSRTRSGSTSVRQVVVDDQLLAKGEQGWTLSRLWTMGHLGGVPNV
ncbi:MAG: AAA family ATPase [Gammaproteobacteria bacterium]|nr:AAA family ATPase [Gammaproteobacteria bacterium]MYG11582.1 AAA family ATPase [Gammaproteobacteria bacterium]MYK29420.1 AAA family ATPase [Gammaproteobacteria bacterium]